MTDFYTMFNSVDFFCYEYGMQTLKYGRRLFVFMDGCHQPYRKQYVTG